ncbi:MAG: hypothetical protein ACI4TZ_00125 [Christensenellales bacterium]
MTFKEWLYSSYENPHINGQWGWLHITTLVLCIAIIVAIALLFKNKSQKSKRIVLFVIAGLILLFEIARRVINLTRNPSYTFNQVLGILLPRPWCAISCWLLMISTLVNKKSFYNLVSITSLLCAIIFFAYPGVGFNNQYILFENLYSIVTHSLILIGSITLITLKFAKFEYKTVWKELIGLAVIFIYAFLEIYVLKIESDPLYFMPGNDIQEILGISSGLYIALYAIFMIVYWNIFYLIADRKNVKKALARFGTKKADETQSKNLNKEHSKTSQNTIASKNEPDSASQASILNNEQTKSQSTENTTADNK